MSWFNREPPKVPADREIPGYQLWVVRLPDGGDLNVMAHEITRSRSNVLAFAEYTGGHWSLDYDFGHCWIWERREVIEIREWIYVAPFRQPEEDMWWHD